MLASFFLLSVFTFSQTYTRFSLTGFQSARRPNTIQRKLIRKSVHDIPNYMWDIYNNGVNSSERDVIKGVFPKFLSTSYCSYRNHIRKEMAFYVPESTQPEILVKAEIRITTSTMKNYNLNFQIYKKTKQWVYVDEKKIIAADTDWLSFEITPQIRSIKSGLVKFSILALFPKPYEDSLKIGDLNPILLLSYYTRQQIYKTRKKRSLHSENYEEMTNRLWDDGQFSKEMSKRYKNSCRKKPLYIKFSEIDFDTWIVAPSGYEAFQCMGKCTFPLSEHLTPTKHAILQTLLHNISPTKAPRACCVPTKLEPISILYIDGNGVLIYRYRYDDMVVAECGCR